MLISLILAATASAQVVENGDVPALNAQLFRPNIDSHRSLWLNDSRVAPKGVWTARGLLMWTKAPLTYVDGDGNRTNIVDDVWQLDLLGGYSFGPVRLGLDVPIYLRSDGAAGGETGLGDLALEAKGRILDGDEAPLGLALQARLAVPTATVDTALGSSGVVWDFAAVADKQFGKALVMANLGTHGQPTVEMTNVVIDDQLFYGVGVGYGSDSRGVSGELVGHATYASLSNQNANPHEFLLGGWFRPMGGDLILRGGLGLPVTEGIGAPAFRALLALGLEPPPARDRDEDGIVDASDRCPDDPEDKDGYVDDDGCPEPTEVTFKFIDGDGVPVADVETVLADQTVRGPRTSALAPGRYTLQAAAKGFAPIEAMVDVPGGAPIEQVYTLEMLMGTVQVRVLGPDGQPLAANIFIGSDNFVDQSEASQAVQPGATTVRVAKKGYLARRLPVDVRPGEASVVEVQLEKELAEVTDLKIEIKDSVYFETGKAVIMSESFQLLNQVATILKEYPEITKVRVEGHTDSRGSDSANLKLSQARAASVRQYLIDHGIDGGRLESQGYGETKPLDTRNVAEAWSKNRRVDFFIAEQKPRKVE